MVASCALLGPSVLGLDRAPLGRDASGMEPTLGSNVSPYEPLGGWGPWGPAEPQWNAALVRMGWALMVAPQPSWPWTSLVPPKS